MADEQIRHGGDGEAAGAGRASGSGPGKRSGSERDLIEEALLEAERAARTPDLPPVDSFKGYEILGEIHRGGQGVVYQALQLATKRRVAIKVLHSGPFTGSSGRTRFEREVQVLGQLSHPHIVKIHDSGVTDAGACFYVMDYISGSTLEEFIGRDPKPDVRTTLTLYSKICEAIGYAHLRGIIHRDLKPSNIRVDRSGEPIVVDFGLAKVALGDVGAGADEPRVMTMTGEFIGSLPWASPEQAEGSAAAIDVRTDVYSLGVILYQLLTGRFPYTVVGNMRDVLENILRTEPAKPSTVRRQVNDEVETIVMKCLAKDRERRYQSGAELARDVKRYLAGEPIEAKRDSVSYMLRKAVRKHKAAASVVAVGLVAIVVFGASMWMAWREASAQRARAEANLASVRSMARSMIFDVNDRIDDLRGATPARQALLSKAQDFLAAIEPQASGDPAFQRELADAHLRVAEIHAGLYMPRVGGLDPATEHLERARAIIDGLQGSDIDTLAITARMKEADGGIQMQRRRYLEAEASFSEASAAYHAAWTLAQADRAAATRLLDARANTQARTADAILRIAQSTPATEPSAATARAQVAEQYAAIETYWQSRVDSDPSDAMAARSLAMTWDRRAMLAIDAAGLLQTAGQHEKAIQTLGQARALARRAADSFRDLALAHPQNADLPRDLYIALHEVGLTHTRAAECIAALAAAGVPEHTSEAAIAERARALAAYEEALSLVEGIMRADESNLEAVRDTYVCLNKVGNELRDTGRAAEAIAVFERSLDLRRQVFRTDPSQRHRNDLAVGLFKRAEIEGIVAEEGPAAERRARLQATERLAVEALGSYQALARDGVLGETGGPIDTVQTLLAEVRVKLGEMRL